MKSVFYLKRFLIYSVTLFVGLFVVTSDTTYAAGKTDKTYYTTKKGDTLAQISKNIYGEAACWPIIAAVPSNTIDYQGYIFPGKKIVIPEKDQCDAIVSPINLPPLSFLQKEKIADISDQPWHKAYLLMDNYIDGIYREKSEWASIDRIGYNQNSMTDHFGEWFNTSQNGSFPMSQYLESSANARPQDIYSEQSYYESITNAPTSIDEKGVEEFWKRQEFRYWDGEKINGIDKIKEHILYKNNTHWGFKVSIPEKEGKYLTPYSFFVIDGKPQQTYYHAHGLIIFPNGDWAYRYQLPTITCESTRMDRCDGPWFIKTNKGEYGPYSNVSPPIAVGEKDIYFWILEDNKYSLYKNGERISQWEFADSLFYTKKAEGLVFRVREGNQWFVVKDGTKSEPWDYVDMISVNNETGTVVYRARKTNGEWLMVKNDTAIPVPFEPHISLNIPLDEPVAMRQWNSEDHTTSTTRIYSTKGDWKFDSAIYPIAINDNGDVLFTSYKTVPVLVDDNKGKERLVCSSAICNFNYSYWINERYIGNATSRMVPLFSKKEGTARPAFFYEGSEEHIEYYGQAIKPAFNNKNELVFYSVKEGKLFKNTYRTTK